MKKLLLLLLFPVYLMAQSEKHNYDTRTERKYDSDVPGWFVNLGELGAKGRLEDNRIIVTYVFKGSLLQVGDIIILSDKDHDLNGLNGEGPKRDLGDLFEKRTTLKVTRNNTTVNLPIDGERFGSNYPYNCKKSEKIVKASLEWLVKEQNPDGSFETDYWFKSVATPVIGLALLSNGNDVKKIVRYIETIDFKADSAYSTWFAGYFAIFLSEYYLIKKDKRVLPYLKKYAGILDELQRDNGMYGHSIVVDPEEAEAENGSAGVIALLAKALLIKCDIQVDKKKLEVHKKWIESLILDNGGVAYNSGSRYGESQSFARNGPAILAFNLLGDSKITKKLLRHFHDYGHTITNAHAVSSMGTLWGVLGATIDKKALRKVMDSHKWFFNLVNNGDGSFSAQPSWDYIENDGDWKWGGRPYHTAVYILCLSVNKKTLVITGRGSKPVSLDKEQIEQYVNSLKRVALVLPAKAYGYCIELKKLTRENKDLNELFSELHKNIEVRQLYRLKTVVQLERFILTCKNSSLRNEAQLKIEEFIQAKETE